MICSEERTAASPPASGELYPKHTVVSTGKISNQYPGLRAPFLLLTGFRDKEQFIMLPNEAPTKRGHGNPADLKVYERARSV